MQPAHQPTRGSNFHRIGPLLHATAGLSCLLLLASHTHANTFDRIVVFGDSLSDVGNVADLTFGLAPGAGYFQGRFSNGPVWVEKLADSFNIARPTRSRAGGRDYAHGGVKTGSGSTSLFLFITAPNIGTQINQFLATNPTRPTDLYVVWGGANDFFDGQTNVTIPASNIAQHVTSLTNAGAKHVLIPNLPPLGETPRFNTSQTDRAAFNARTASYNADLAQRLSTLATQTSANLYPLQVDDRFADILAAPSTFGFTNVTTRALNGSTVVSNPDQFLFFDDVHPTRVGHDLIAESAFGLLSLRELAGSASTLDWTNDASWKPSVRPDRFSDVQLRSTSPRRVDLDTSAAARRVTVASQSLLDLTARLSLNESLRVETGGSLGVTLSAAGSSLVEAAQIVMSAGSELKVNRSDGFLPTPGDRYEIGLADVLNVNANILGIDALPGLQFSIETAGRSLGLLASATPGDVDLNGLVGFSDLLVLARNYGSTSSTPWHCGDLDRSGAVDFADLLILARNYGPSTLPTSHDGIGLQVWSDFQLAMQIVPEPSTLGLIGSIGLLASRSRRSTRVLR